MSKEATLTILKGLNMVSSLFIVAMGVLEIIKFTVVSIVIGAYMCFLGLSLIAIDFAKIDYIKKNMSFLQTHVGRGVTLGICAAVLYFDTGVLFFGFLIILSTAVLHLFLYWFKTPFP